MADCLLYLISVLIIVHYACITFQKLGIAREGGGTQPTGLNRGVSSDLHFCNSATMECRAFKPIVLKFSVDIRGVYLKTCFSWLRTAAFILVQ